MSGGRAAVEVLRAENVGCVFGLIGSATMELFDALYDAPDVRFIGVRDERTGTHMADGYARASGGPGVIIAGQNGPGTTNLTTGLAQARAAYSPVVSLSGMLSSGHIYRDAFQEVDQQALFQPITKKTWTVPSADRVPEIVREGFRTALTPRCGPVHINLPRDVLAATADFGHSQLSEKKRATCLPAATGDLVERAAELLVKAKRPLILAGGGLKSIERQRSLLALAEHLDTPIATSPGHGDVVPHDHPLNAGQVGPRGNPVASALAREADVILALGTRLGFNTTFYSYDHINRDARIIQVEIEPTAIGRFFPIALGIWADAAATARQIVTALGNRGPDKEAVKWREKFQVNRKAFLEEREHNSKDLGIPLQPAEIFRLLRGSLPQDAAITMDAGTLCLQATDSLRLGPAPGLFTPLDFGLVGFSFACGLGIKAACPDRSVISLMGDGGFGMTVSELSTAVAAGLNTVTLVMNNHCWGAEKAYQRDFFGERYIGADISSPPFDKLAELYGAVGFRAESADQVEGALEAALDCGKPSVIDVQVDPNALYSFRRDSFAHRAKST